MAKYGDHSQAASEDLANTDSLGAIEGGEVQCVDSYWVMNSITDYCVEDLHKSKARAASAKC